ncbi:MAG: acyltransferase [Tepidisphaeraceae bacterium]|jgi:peptidoglycan/LPS O-acetylase OafA/YrhL
MMETLLQGTRKLRQFFEDMNLRNPARGTRLPGLDGLRAVSIVLVVICHLAQSPQFPKIGWLGQLAMEGQFGVQIFFVISGFLITWLFIDEEQKRGRISLTKFFMRRAVRIFPPALAYLLVLRFLAAAGVLQCGWRDVAYGALFIRNVLPGPVATNHFWALAIEQQFYLMWPLLVVLLAMRGRIALIVAAIIFVPLWRYAHVANLMGFHEVSIWRFDVMCDSLLAGCLLGLLRQNPGTSALMRGPYLQSRWAVVLAILVGVAAIAQPFHASSLSRAALPAVKALGVAVVINFAVHGHDSWMDRFLNLAPMAWMGRLSYSLYIWQQIFCCDYYPWHHYNAIPLNLILTLACASASYYILEQPLARVRGRLERGTHTATAVAPIRQRAASL